MTRPVVFRPVAREEYDCAFEWYENQQPGLGIDFEDEVEQVLAAIAARPKRYPVVHRDIQEDRSVVSRTASITASVGDN